MDEADKPNLERTTIREQLERRKTICETELQNLNEALNLMDTVPNFDDIFDAVRKAGF